MKSDVFNTKFSLLVKVSPFLNATRLLKLILLLLKSIKKNLRDKLSSKVILYNKKRLTSEINEINIKNYNEKLKFSSPISGV